MLPKRLLPAVRTAGYAGRGGLQTPVAERARRCRRSQGLRSGRQRSRVTGTSLPTIPMTYGIRALRSTGLLAPVRLRTERGQSAHLGWLLQRDRDLSATDFAVSRVRTVLALRAAQQARVPSHRAGLCVTLQALHGGWPCQSADVDQHRPAGLAPHVACGLADRGTPPPGGHPPHETEP